MKEYSNGYLPKIAFHMAHGNVERVEYFTHRQISVYGELTPWDMGLICTEVTRMQRTWKQEEQEFQSHLGRY